MVFGPLWRSQSTPGQSSNSEIGHGKFLENKRAMDPSSKFRSPSGTFFCSTFAIVAARSSHELFALITIWIIGGSSMMIEYSYGKMDGKKSWLNQP